MPLNAPYHSSMEKEVRKAANIINSFFRNSTVDADSSIPAELIKNCAGLAFLTVIKAGMIWTGKVGTGLVIARLEDGSWSAPSGIGTAGLGFGAEIGGEIVDFMIVLGSRGAVNTFKKGTQVSVGAGLELAVGPLGRAAGASVNASGGGLSANYTYSRAKGAFAGVGLHGSTILVRGEMNSKFYGREVKPMEILSGHVPVPPGTCDVLYEAIAMAEGSQGVSMYPSSDPRSSSYNGNSSRGSFDSRSSFNGSYNNGSYGNGSFNNGSFNGGRDSLSTVSAPTTTPSASSSVRSSISAAATTQPSADDPRLRRYTTYKSERELYEQYAKTKSPASTTSTASAQSYGSTNGAGYAAPATASAPAQVATGYGAPVSSAPAPVSTGYGAPAAHSSGAYGSSYGYNAAPAAAPVAQTAPPTTAPAPAPMPTRLSYKTVPASAYVPNYGAPTPSAPKTQAPPLPPPALGAETKQVYTQVINFVSSKCPHANVQIFKDNCRLFGQDQMSLDAYLAYLTSICTTSLMKELVPQLVRLLPTQDKREKLWALYVREVLMIH